MNAEGKKLISLAKDSIASQLTGSELEISDDIKKEFSQEQGVFVTLTVNGELRGCIGFPEPMYPLWEGVVEAAKSAAFSDPRFPPLTGEEFDDIEIEVSVLTVPREIKVKKPEEYLKQIKIGEDGLIIRGVSSGLLLPQVFSEYNCDAEQALEMTCEKAMLPSDAWKDPNNKIYKFQAIIYSESKPEKHKG